jgi:hypothetical protein
MIRRTLSQARPELTRIAATSGLNASDGRILSRLNIATEELMNEGDWPGIVDRYLFRSATGDIILPSFLDRILGVAVNNLPYSMRSPWFEFVEYGPGPQGGCNWIDAVIDRGETSIQFPFPDLSSGPWTLYSISELSEAGQILVQGRLANGREVRTQPIGGTYVSGEYLYFSPPGSPNYGTQQFAEITAVEKPVTQGYIELWATNGNPTQDIILGAYGPNDTTPSYHGYFLPSLHLDCYRGCCCGTRSPSGTHGPMEVLVRARRRFVPLTDETDTLLISNLPALVSMIMAIQKREVGDVEGYANYKGAAIGLMRGEALSYRGKVKQPAVTFERGVSFGDFTYVR